MTPPGAQERAAQAVRAILDELAMAGFKWEEYPTLVDAIERHVDQAVAQAVQVAFDDVDEIVGTWAAAYPEDVFRPFVASDHPHVSPDRIGAEMGRHMARELRKQIAALRARPTEPTGETG